jgi:hypothetical protein
MAPEERVAAARRRKEPANDGESVAVWDSFVASSWVSWTGNEASFGRRSLVERRTTSKGSKLWQIVSMHP